MPDDMDFVTAALSTDVGGTLYTACKRLGVTKDTSVAIFGVGPMGMGGVIIASALGAKVIAVDGNPSGLPLRWKTAHSTQWTARRKTRSSAYGS